MYWQGECETYSKAELLVPKKLWEVPQSFSSGKLFLVLQNSLNGEGIENIDPSPSNVNKSLRLVGQDDVIVGEMYDMLVSSFTSVLNKFRWKSLRRIRQIPQSKLTKLIMLWHISACIRMRCQEHFGPRRA